MSLHYIYSNSSNTTLDITQYCRLYRYASTTDAKEGSTAISTLIVDDPDGTLDFTGHRRLYTYEDLAPANEQVVHNGYIANENVSRGPYRTGAGRIWTLRISDTNVLLNRRIMNGTDANRSAENDLQRIQALLTMTELNTIDDSLYVNTAAATTTMDAVDYRGQPAGTGYIADCAQASGKNYFAWYREATGENSLWYDFASSSNWSSAIRLTNSLADVDDTTTFAIDLENQAELDRSPDRIASGIYLTYDGGTVYVQNAATTAAFGAIDWAAPSSNVKTLAKATARANRYLAEAATEDDLINVSVKLPAANVNDILAGMRVECSFTHLPGYEAYSWMRCLSRTVTEISEDPTRAYRLDLELAPAPLIGQGLFAVVFQIYAAGSGSDPSVKVGNGAGPSWTKLGSIETTDQDYPGVGTVSLINTSLWWTEITDGMSPTNIAYVEPGGDSLCGAWVFQVAGVGDMSGATVYTDNADEANGTDHALGTGAANSVLFGGYGIALLAYAYGLTITALTDTTLEVAADQDNDPVTTDADLFPPWCVVAWHEGTGSIDTHIAPSPSYDPYTTLHQAGVAVLAPLIGPFSVTQSAHNNGGLLAAFGVTLPGSP